LAQISKKYPKEQNHSPSKENMYAQESDLAPFFGDLSRSEKLSEIKPPLSVCYDN
jgi:hypothetical protein